MRDFSKGAGVLGRVTGVALVLASGVLLGGCGTIFGKTAPDESQVTDNPSLVLPPNFDLRPPREAADYESALRDRQGAENTRRLIGGSAQTTSDTMPVAGAATLDTSAAQGNGDAWLTGKAGAGEVNIRSTVDAERAADKASAKAAREGSFWHRWFGWMSGGDD